MKTLCGNAPQIFFIYHEPSGQHPKPLDSSPALKIMKTQRESYSKPVKLDYDDLVKLGIWIHITLKNERESL